MSSLREALAPLALLGWVLRIQYGLGGNYINILTQQMNTIILVGPPDRHNCVFASAVIAFDVVSMCRRAQLLQFCLTTMAWTPTWHPVHSARGRTGMASVDSGQSGAPLPSTTPQLSPQSFTGYARHIEFDFSSEETDANLRIAPVEDLIRCKQCTWPFYIPKSLRNMSPCILVTIQRWGPVRVSLFMYYVRIIIL